MKNYLANYNVRVERNSLYAGKMVEDLFSQWVDFQAKDDGDSKTKIENLIERIKKEPDVKEISLIRLVEVREVPLE